MQQLASSTSGRCCDRIPITLPPPDKTPCWTILCEIIFNSYHHRAALNVTVSSTAAGLTAQPPKTPPAPARLASGETRDDYLNVAWRAFHLTFEKRVSGNFVTNSPNRDCSGTSEGLISLTNYNFTFMNKRRRRLLVVATVISPVWIADLEARGCLVYR
jgi:hypothetical protein